MCAFICHSLFLPTLPLVCFLQFSVPRFSFNNLTTFFTQSKGGLGPFWNFWAAEPQRCNNIKPLIHYLSYAVVLVLLCADEADAVFFLGEGIPAYTDFGKHLGSPLGRTALNKCKLLLLFHQEELQNLQLVSLF